MPYLLALDQGTHASRAALFTENGDSLFSHTEAIALDRIDAHRVEQNPQQIIQSLQTCVSAALAFASAHNEPIRTCGLAIQRSSVLAWNSRGEALSPVLSWQDTRGEQQLKKLRSQQHDIQAITGLPLSAHYGASKLAWLQQHIDTTENVRLSPLASFVLFHLLRDPPYLIDHVNAQRTQLFSLSQRDWSSRLVDQFGIPLHCLPECSPVLHDYGQLAQAPIPLSAVSGDQNAALYSNGELSHDTILVNVGSGAFALQLLDQYQSSDKQLTGIACSDSQQTVYLREATVNGAGSALQWLQQQYPQTRIQSQLDDWLHHIDDAPVFINSIGGLGSPWWRNEPEPHFINSDRSNQLTLPRKAVAVVESIAFMLHANIDLMRQQQTAGRIYISGGLSQLDGLCQRLANLTRLEVDRSENSEATARGIAWLAANRPVHWRIEPRQKFFPAPCDALRQRYQRFMASLDQPSSSG